MRNHPVTDSKEDIISATKKFVTKYHTGDSTGHDFLHILRVTTLAGKIAGDEKADVFITSMAALLHDLLDWKTGAEKIEKRRREMEDFINSQDINLTEKNAILGIIENVSFKGSAEEDNKLSVEGEIVRDADRLDAIGAIGVARAFAFGGSHSRAIFDPDVPFQKQQKFEAYSTSKGSTINHFYEKLLLLKDRMVTKTAREMAIERHKFLERFLDQFTQEWDEALKK